MEAINSKISIPGRNIRRLQDNQTVYPTENPAASLPGQQSDRIKNCTQIFRLYLLFAYSGTGKTTFLERLIPKLKARGLKIAIVKHDGHRFEIDHEGKDSDRFTKAGADVTGLISSEKAVLMENRQTDPEEFLKKIDGVDLILTEGFKQGPWPKIMLHRKGTGKPMPLLPEECLAVISDVEILDCKNVFHWKRLRKRTDFLFPLYTEYIMIIIVN